MAITAETLTLAALLIAPGVIAVLLAITLGVVEQEIDRDQLYLTSFVSSIFIDVIFIWIVQDWWGKRVTDRSSLESVFFGETQFHVEAAVLLFVLSCGLGIIYGLFLTFNVAHVVRGIITKFTSHRRNPWQPWEGGLRNASQVMVELEDGTDVIGLLAEYSRVGKERQLVLHYPQFLEFEEGPNRKKVIIAEDEIALVHVMSTRRREGIRTKIRKKAINKWRRIKNDFCEGKEVGKSGNE